VPADLRFALRSLRATPTFTAVALLILTLGIGATTAIYSVVDAVALRGLPFERADRLMIVDETNPTGKGLLGGYVAAPNFFDWRAQQQTFEDLAAFQGLFLTTFDSGKPEQLRGEMVSSSLMHLLRVGPAVGHVFTPAEEVRGRNHVALISDGFWRRRFGADPHIVGKTFTSGEPGAAQPQPTDGAWEVIGVMPAGFQFPVGALKPYEFWAPYVPTADEYPRGDGSSRNYNAQVVGRLKDGVTREQAYADMARITGALKGQYPKWFRDRWVGVTPLHESIVGKSRGWMFLLLGAVAFVLLIACVNVANLMLARATSRSRDIGVRAALGASRWQLARGLLVESLLLSCAGTVLGVIAAYWSVRVMRAELPPSLPRLSEVGIDLRVLTIAAVAAIVTGVLFGGLPAWQLSRPRLVDALREGGRSGAAGMAKQRARSLLLIAEVALAVVLLVGAGLFVSSFVRLVHVDLGIGTSKIVTLGVYPRIDFSQDRVHMDQAMARAAVLVGDVLDRARALPGVQDVAVASGTPALGGGWSRSSLSIPGEPKSEDPDDSPDQKTVTAGYFHLMGVPILNGREFADADSAAGAEKVIIINDVAVARLFKGRHPIGMVVESNGKRTVVGVVRAVRNGGPEAPLRPEVYTPWDKSRAFGGTLYVRTNGDPAMVSPALRGLVQGVLTNVVVADTQTLDQMYDTLIVQRKFNMVVLALFGVLAIAIAAAGIYGVMAYIVEQRTPEIGVRMALGAQPAQVLRMILSRASMFMAIGIAIGLAAGWILARFVSAFLFEVSPHDAIVCVVAAAVLVTAGLVAAFIPARRASRVDPLQVLR
jgi:putative ABC transport system permease protein